MRTIVMKFGGAAVQSLRHIEKAALLIENKRQEFEHIIVVVSAMANMTDNLFRLAAAVHPNPPKREVDMLISVGERVSMSLLAMALDKRGLSAISFTGSQSGIITSDRHTDAKITNVRPLRLLKHLEEGKIVIVAGFQGVSPAHEITTLGRGGGDTTAVALAVAFGAEKAEFYKDVEGVFAQDPKKNPGAEFYPYLNYRQTLDIVKKGAKILHPRAVCLAAKNFLPLQIRSFQNSAEGTLIEERAPVPRPAPVFEVEI